MYLIAITTTVGISNVPRISDELIGVMFSTIITGIITIVGFVITYFSMKNSFKNELRKQNKIIITEKLSDLSDRLIKLLRECSDSLSEDKERQPLLEEDLYEQVDEAISDLMLFGTNEMIDVLYYASKYLKDTTKHKMVLTISAFMLIFVMLRYEFTGAMINTEKYFSIVIDDATNYFDLFKQYNNEIVTNLKLNKKYLIN